MATVGEPGRDRLIVAIDEVVVIPAAGKGPQKVLHPSDFMWLGRKEARRLVRNSGDKEARFVTLAFKPVL
jgi:hypothetical protein